MASDKTIRLSRLLASPLFRHVLDKLEDHWDMAWHFALEELTGEKVIATTDTLQEVAVKCVVRNFPDIDEVTDFQDARRIAEGILTELLQDVGQARELLT